MSAVCFDACVFPADRWALVFKLACGLSVIICDGICWLFDIVYLVLLEFVEPCVCVLG
jgi:hypothetical protein